MAYTTSLLIALVQFRNFMKPFGFASFAVPNNMLIFDSVDVIKCIIDKSQDNSFPVSNLRDELLKITFSYVPEIHDKLIIKSFISQVLSENVFKDDFSIACEKVIVKHSNKWSIPADGTVQNYAQAAQSLPVFTTPEILGVYARPIRNWNMAILNK